MYKVCESCKGFRAGGDLALCLTCRSCKGTGIVRDPSTYVCNGCGGTLCPRPGSGPHGLVEATVDGGYESTHLFDTVNYRFSLCEKCLRDMFDRFAVPPTVWSSVGDDSDYVRDSEQHRLRSWRESGGHTAKLATGLCNASPECREVAQWRVFFSGHMTDLALCAGHRAECLARNGRFVPASVVSDVPADKSDRTLEQKIRLADEYLKAVTRADGLPMFFRYLDDCVKDVVGDGRSVGGFWIPNGSSIADPQFYRDADLQPVFSFPSGSLFLCDSARVGQVAGRHGIRPEPDFDELYPELCDDLSVGD